MKQRFRYSNKEYSRLIYEYIGIWPEHAQYTEDNTVYYLYYNNEQAQKIQSHIRQLYMLLGRLEGATVCWQEEQRCLVIQK